MATHYCVLTEEKRNAAEKLYQTTKMSVTDIAKQIGVGQATLSHWITKQEWYKPRRTSRAQKVAEELGIGKGNIVEANANKEPNSFVIPWRLPGMNEYIAAINSHRQRGNDFKRSTEQGIILCAKIGLPKDFTVGCKAEVHVTWFEKDRKRDYDNIRSGLKFILDALQRANVLQGDGQSYLFPPTDTFEIDKKNPRVVVTLVPHPEIPIEVKERSVSSTVGRPKKAKESSLRYMDDGEIRRAYADAKDKRAQIGILADLNAVSETEIRRIIGEG